MMRSTKIVGFVLIATISHGALGFSIITLPVKCSLSVPSCSSSRIYSKNSNLPIADDKADNNIKLKGEEDDADCEDRENKPLHYSKRTPAREPDSPDRALAIVSELKSNAALFAAFAYGGLSLPSLMTVTESKITSVTTSISTARPLPGSDLIQAFVILDTATLCLMIACVAASQLLIYRLTDGSWYDDELLEEETRSPGASSAMGRLMTDYGLEFTVARTTFDLGLLVLLLAVAVRAISIFDASISLPILILLGTTSFMLAGAYLQSYFKVFRPIEQQQSQKETHKNGKTATNTITTLVPSILLAVAAAMFYLNSDPNLPTVTTTNSSPDGLSARLAAYSSAAGESKLKLTAGSVAEERSGVSGNNKDSSSKKKSVAQSKKPTANEKAALTPKKDKSSSVVDEKADSSSTTRKEPTKKASSPENVVAEEDGNKSEKKEKAQKASRPEIVAAEEDKTEKKDKVASISTMSSSKDEISTVLDDVGVEGYG